MCAALFLAILFYHEKKPKNNSKTAKNGIAV